MEIKNKSGYLFYDSNCGGDASLLLHAVIDVGEILGHSLENPLSLYLVCLDLGIPAESCHDISSEMIRVFMSGIETKLAVYEHVKKI